MSLRFDHVFVFVPPGAQAADLLVAAGLVEGPPNQHPGQGTANRRFFLANAMLELLWVHEADAADAATQSNAARAIRRAAIMRASLARFGAAEGIGLQCALATDREGVPPC